jgi:hypothetical protein
MGGPAAAPAVVMVPTAISLFAQTYHTSRRLVTEQRLHPHICGGVIWVELMAKLRLGGENQAGVGGPSTIKNYPTFQAKRGLDQAIADGRQNYEPIGEADSRRS